MRTSFSARSVSQPILHLDFAALLPHSSCIHPDRLARPGRHDRTAEMFTSNPPKSSALRLPARTTAAAYYHPASVSTYSKSWLVSLALHISAKHPPAPAS
ncbi:hypothetical protein EJB05_23942, partial [Eragrostis curvula]